MKKSPFLLGALLGTAVLVTACSSSAQSGSVASSAQSGSVASGSGASIPVGVVGSFSGPAASSLAVGKLAIQAWADSVNAAGGIKGHKVQLYIVDDQGSSAIGLSGVKQLVEQDHVVAIVGELASSSDTAWASYVQQVGVPVVGGQANDPPYLTNPDFYSASGNLITNYYGIAAAAKTNGPKLGNIYCAELPACAATTTLLTSLGSPLGVKVSYSSSLAASSPDDTAECQGLKSTGVQSYSLGLAASTLKQVATQCGQQGVTARLIVPNVADSTFASVPAFNNMEIVDTNFPFFEDSTPATKAFHAALAKYAPSVGSASAPLNPYVAQEWVAGKLFEAAVEGGGSGPVTSASVKKGLYSLNNATLGGLTQPLNFTPNKPTLHDCYYTYTITDGKFVSPDGMTPSCAPASLVSAEASKLGL